mmetsp:Transcript_14581/g.37131  ORF Transcript_14581/g.37131 Transcript_14581/m.37131 type:complete len:510 (+) Transcript_14581:125-1654(+)
MAKPSKEDKEHKVKKDGKDKKDKKDKKEKQAKEHKEAKSGAGNSAPAPVAKATQSGELPRAGIVIRGAPPPKAAMIGRGVINGVPPPKAAIGSSAGPTQTGNAVIAAPVRVSQISGAPPPAAARVGAGQGAQNDTTSSQTPVGPLNPRTPLGPSGVAPPQTPSGPMGVRPPQTPSGPMGVRPPQTPSGPMGVRPPQTPSGPMGVRPPQTPGGPAGFGVPPPATPAGFSFGVKPPQTPGGPLASSASGVPLPTWAEVASSREDDDDAVANVVPMTPAMPSTRASALRTSSAGDGLSAISAPPPLSSSTMLSSLEPLEPFPTGLAGRGAPKTPAAITFGQAPTARSSAPMTPAAIRGSAVAPATPAAIRGGGGAGAGAGPAPTTPTAIAGSRLVGGVAPGTPAVIKDHGKQAPPTPTQEPSEGKAPPVEPPALSKPPPEPEREPKRERPAQFASKFAPKRKKDANSTAVVKEEKEPVKEEAPEISLGTSFEQWNVIKTKQAEAADAAAAEN